MSQAKLLELDVAPARPNELNFVLSAWKKSFRHSPANESLPQAEYWARANRDINRLASKCKVRVARDTDDGDFAYGFIAYNLDAADLYVHFAYVRHGYRRLGVGRALLNDVLVDVPDSGRLYFTHRTRFDAEIEAMGFEYVKGVV